MGLFIGAPLFYRPYYSYYDPYYSYYDPYVYDYPPLYRSYPPSRPIIVPESRSVGDDLFIDRLRDNMIRLRWQGDASSVDEVALYLADAHEKVLAVQTLNAFPAKAVFEKTSGAVFAGISVVYANGEKATALIPLDRQRK